MVNVMIEINKIYCMDALEGMKMIEDGSVSLIIADPPYNSPAVEWDRKNDEWQIKWLKEAERVLREGGGIYVFFAPLSMYSVEGFIRGNFNLRNILVWHHPNLYGAYLSYGKDRYKSTWDAIFYAIKGKKSRIEDVGSRAYKSGSGFDVVIEPQPRPLRHKAEKPLKLIMRLVYASSNFGDIVLDPFIGSGTTPVACELLGRKWIGFDNDPESIKVADERLKHTFRSKTLVEVFE